MKVELLKWANIALLGLVLSACGNKSADSNNTTSTEQTTASDVATVANYNSSEKPTLSTANQALAKNCEQNSQDDCKQLIENLASECKNNNAQSCVDVAVLFIKLNSEAVKANNNQLALQSYNLAVGSLVKACDLKNQEACNSLKELSNNIFSNLKSVKENCVNNKDPDACKIVEQATKILSESCKAGRQQDCTYLNELH